MGNEGYKKTTNVKKEGDKPTFSKFVKIFQPNKNSESTLSITTQNANNDKYFKLYKINSELVNSEIDNLENTLRFTHTDDEIFFGFNMSMYETLKNEYVDKYEYIYPELLFSKNLFSSASLAL